jgi:N-acetylglucosaminyl-diphospho-decaprenol L-rhamnosyltransferase
MNVGVERARHDAVIMLNPDTELIDDSLGRLAQASLTLQAIVGPRVLNPDLSVQPSASGPQAGPWPWIRAVVPGAIAPTWIQRRTEPYRLNQRTPVNWLTASALAGPRNLLLQLGPFDAALFLYGEDVDLGLRAERIGVPQWFCPDTARIVHHGAASSSLVYGTRDGWRGDGARAWRAVLRRVYGDRRERWAWWALKTNLGLRLAAKSALKRASVRDRADYRAIVSAEPTLELPPLENEPVRSQSPVA